MARKTKMLKKIVSDLKTNPVFAKASVDLSENQSLAGMEVFCA
jgi:hypothetical protein